MELAASSSKPDSSYSEWSSDSSSYGYSSSLPSVDSVEQVRVRPRSFYLLALRLGIPALPAALFASWVLEPPVMECLTPSQQQFSGRDAPGYSFIQTGGVAPRHPKSSKTSKRGFSFGYLRLLLIFDGGLKTQCRSPRLRLGIASFGRLTKPRPQMTMHPP